MKRRSIFAAVAMLVVSAIVLSSATYAWFAANNSASVTQIEATVTNATGNLTLQATGTNAKDTSEKLALSNTDYYLSSVAADVTAANAAGKTTVLTSLTPVSLSCSAAGAISTYKVGYDATYFTAGGAGSENVDYMAYSFNVKYANSDTAKSIKMTPTWSGSAFTYGIVQVTVDGTTTNYFYGGSSGDLSDSDATTPYEPVASVTAASITDSAPKTIIDATDTGYSAADMTDLEAGGLVEGPTAATEIFAVTAGGGAKTATVKVIVWAEGQDAQCNGDLGTNTSYFTFGFAAV